MVESQTVVGTKQHGRGTVDAQIIKADIPVQVNFENCSNICQN